MVRLSVWLTDEQKAWVEATADDRNVGQAELVRELIDAARESESIVNQPPNSTESKSESVSDSVLNQSDSATDYLAETAARLEAAVDRLEAATGESTGDSVSESKSESAVNQSANEPGALSEPSNGAQSATGGEKMNTTQGDADGGLSDADDAPAAVDVRAKLGDELPGSGDTLEARINAILAMYELLRDQGTAEKDDFLDAVDVDATGYASRESVWSNMVKGRDTLRALPGVETPPQGGTRWEYHGE